jgi:hypothetical protein
MKDVHEVLRQKEADLSRVRREIESLQIVASLLSDESKTDELPKKPASSAEDVSEAPEESEATGTGGLFSSAAPPAPRSNFWKILKRDQ